MRVNPFHALEIDARFGDETLLLAVLENGEYDFEGHLLALVDSLDVIFHFVSPVDEAASHSEVLDQGQLDLKEATASHEHPVMLFEALVVILLLLFLLQQGVHLLLPFINVANFLRQCMNFFGHYFQTSRFLM